jgi:MarR family transcriptional regulator, negative regulator of the multidrug operon emrRAB
LNNFALQFRQIEVTLEQLRARVPELPEVPGALLSRLLLHLGRGISGMLEHDIKPYGLAEAEFRVLTTLFSQPDGMAHPGELCARSSQSAANISRICDALVGRDLITRVSSLHDRRKMVLRITGLGEALVRRVLPMLFDPLRELLQDFPDGEQQQLIAQLKRLGSKLEGAMAQRGSERAV